MAIRTSLSFVLTLGLLLPAVGPTAAQERIPAPKEVLESVGLLPEDAAASALPSDLALVPADAALFVSMRVADVWHSKAARLFSQHLEFQAELRTALAPFGLTFGNIERFTFVLSKEGPVFLFRLKKPPVRNKVVKAMAPHAERTSLKGKSCYINEETWSGVIWVDGQTLAYGCIPALEKVLATAERKGHLQKALHEASRERHLVVAVQPALLARACGFSFDKAPEVVRATVYGETLRLLGEGRCLLLTAQFSAHELQLDGWADYATAREAARAEKVVQAGKQALVKQLPTRWRGEEPDEEDPTAAALRRFARATAAGLKEMTIQREEAAIKMAVTIRAANTVLGLASFELAWGWGDADWTGPQSRTMVPARLGQLGQAMLAYHKKNGRLPAPAVRDKDGKQLLSWRVALLPFLGEMELYKQFHLDEPWDSEHNRKLIPRMPKVFSQWDSDDSPTTVFQVFAGRGTAFDSKKGRRLSDCKDGPEQTILIAEAARAVPWTKPDDMPYSATRPLAHFGLGPWPNMVLADGQVIQLPGKSVGAGKKKDQGWVFDGPGGLGAKNIRALITRSGGDQEEARALLKRCQAIRATTPPGEVQPASYQSVPGGVPLPMFPPLPPPPPFSQPPQAPRSFISAPMLLPGLLPSPPQPAEPATPQPREDQPR